MDTENNYEAFPPLASPYTPGALRLHHARSGLLPEHRCPPSPPPSIIYRDLLNQEQMFPDGYKVPEIADGLCLWGSRPEGEGTQTTVIAGVAIVLNHPLQEKTSEKKPTGSTSGLGEINQRGTRKTESRRSKAFYDRGCRANQAVLAHGQNGQICTGQNMNPDGAVALLDHRKDAVTPWMICF
ncbi:translationally-controlled tumor protein-like [Molossus nigricans]